jgi:cytochrome c peroxidase
LAVVIILFQSCKVDTKINAPLPTDNIVEVIPPGWPQPVYTFSTNVLTKEGFILGRELFYEENLSADNTISCGSCHQDFSAFAHSDHNVSHGINDQLGTRNSPGLFNLNWHTSFLHDGGVNHIENFPLAPILNPIEMGETDLNNLIGRLQATSKYKTLFKNAFGTEEVTSQKMLRAITQFIGTMYSYNSKYDMVKRNENNARFSNEEQSGYELFIAKCATCHKEPLFSDFEYRSNGLPADIYLKDSGRSHITGLLTDAFKFKTPSLRNVAKTAPYMHDGRFSTLNQCLDHYTNGVTNLTNPAPQLQPNGLQMSAADKNNIIAFLNTLTDYKFLNDKRFSDPDAK